MITPIKFNAGALPVGAAVVYTVTPAQKGIVKGLTVHNETVTPCTVTVIVFGVQIYTYKTLGPYETFECASAINKIGLAGDTITVNPSAAAAVNVLGSAIEMAAS
jgi:hypothetical protein